ncbi:MAG: helix-turn-helix domain-containing protein [Streptococcus sp.]
MLQISFNGARLKEARLFNKKSITQIAEFLNVSKQMVSKYEKGRATPSEESLEILEKKLKFPRDFFFGNDNFTVLQAHFLEVVTQRLKQKKCLQK